MTVRTPGGGVSIRPRGTQRARGRAGALSVAGATWRGVLSRVPKKDFSLGAVRRAMAAGKRAFGVKPGEARGRAVADRNTQERAMGIRRGRKR